MWPPGLCLVGSAFFFNENLESWNTLMSILHLWSFRKTAGNDYALSLLHVKWLSVQPWYTLFFSYFYCQSSSNAWLPRALYAIWQSKVFFSSSVSKMSRTFELATPKNVQLHYLLFQCQLFGNTWCPNSSVNANKSTKREVEGVVLIESVNNKSENVKW